jgi:L-ascorbate metabolism protein UlaG (beta-lactamase superfamily)
MLNRRTVVGGGVGLGGLAVFAYQMAPAFFRRMNEERKREVHPAPRRPDFKAFRRKGLHAAWIGHTTVLLSIDGFTILTDPVFSARIGVRVGPMTVGLKRLVAPAADIFEVPRPDLILLSHAHMDHFDLPSLRKLESRVTAVITAANTSDLLRVRRYGSVRELRWNEAARVGPVSVRAFQVNHWGARMRSDTYRSYNGYVIETGRHRVLFGGDTAYTDAFREVRSSKAVDLAIMPIGAYNPWIRAHCTPEQAWTMANHAGAEFVLPVHHRTFELSREPLNEPIERLLDAAGSSPDRVCVRGIGEEFHLS